MQSEVLLIKILRHIFIFILFISTISNAAAQNDSVRVGGRKVFNFKGILSSTYRSGSISEENSKSSLAFENTLDMNYNHYSKQFKKQLVFKSDLEFIKISDSIWTKSSDKWQVTLRYIRNMPHRINHTYSLLVSSQYLDSYRYRKSKGMMIKEWRGNLFNPGKLVFSYGLSKAFWDNCSITASFANIKIYTKPIYISKENDTEHFAQTKYARIYSEYGISVSTFIERSISEYLYIENSLFFFSNAINRDKVNFDCYNAIVLRVFRFACLKITNKINYDPYLSYHLLMETKVSLGIILDYKNGVMNKYDLKRVLK